MHNTKEGLANVAWENIVSYHEAGTTQNGESLGKFFYFSILLISCLPNVSNKTYNDTGDNNFLQNT